MRLRGRAGSLALAWALAPDKDPVRWAATPLERYAEEWWRASDAAIMHADTLGHKTLVKGQQVAVQRQQALPPAAPCAKRSNGPMADCCLWMGQVGWEWSSANEVTNRKGQAMIMVMGPPAVLRRIFIEDYHDMEIERETRRLLVGNETREAAAIR